MKKTATFYGVGVGPGDPELITVKALRVLEECGVIAVPTAKGSTGDAEPRALEVVRKALKGLDTKEVMGLFLPMTRDEEVLRASREEAASRVVEKLREGRDVSFITLGDPMLYSTFSYLVPLVRALLPGASVRVVPGVSSISAAASAGCTPLAESGEKVIIVPALHDLKGLKPLFESFDTVVLMKVNRDVDALVKLLEEAGLAERALFVSKVGWPEEEVIRDLRELKDRKIDYFSMVIVRARKA
ncbi:MAG TPA: precorrin-2 C(20)-methyltransferase [Thermodesulfobacteriota bacterium]|nr:precorrin-2 C(20)-methyltransferase [Thermodesulfobacteriota bacterium]